MKNVTLSVEEDVLARVRRYASQRETSVNALVREFLRSLAEKEDRARHARAKLRELSRRSRARMGVRSWTRDDLHER
jgi:hypothetical protein